jgi:hypothetical protein
MILGAFDSLIPSNCMRSSQSLLADHDQIARFYKRPFQVAICVPTDLPHAVMATAGTYAWH